MTPISHDVSDAWNAALDRSNGTLDESSAYAASHLCSIVLYAMQPERRLYYSIRGVPLNGDMVLVSAFYAPLCLVFIVLSVLCCTGRGTFHDTGKAGDSAPKQMPKKPVLLLSSLMATTAKLFMVSYAHRMQLKWLPDWLALNLPDCWIDKSCLATGTRLQDEIRRATAHSRCLIILLTPEYLSSVNCLLELFTAVSLRSFNHATSSTLHTIVLMLPTKHEPPKDEREGGKQSPSPTVSVAGEAFQAGRLEGCGVCLDKRNNTAKCDCCPQNSPNSGSCATLWQSLTGLLQSYGFAVFDRDLDGMLLHIHTNILDISREGWAPTLSWFTAYASHPNRQIVAALRHSKPGDEIPTVTMCNQPLFAARAPLRSSATVPSGDCVTAGRVVLLPDATKAVYMYPGLLRPARIIALMYFLLMGVALGVVLIWQLHRIASAPNEPTRLQLIYVGICVASAMVLLLGLGPIFLRELRASDPRRTYSPCLHGLLVAAHCTSSAGAQGSDLPSNGGIHPSRADLGLVAKEGHGRAAASATTAAIQPREANVHSGGASSSSAATPQAEHRNISSCSIDVARQVVAPAGAACSLALTAQDANSAAQTACEPLFRVFLVRDRRSAEAQEPSCSNKAIRGSVPKAQVADVLEAVQTFLGAGGIGLHVTALSVEEAADRAKKTWGSDPKAITTGADREIRGGIRPRALFIFFLDTVDSARVWWPVRDCVPSHSLILVVDGAMCHSSVRLPIAPKEHQNSAGAQPDNAASSAPRAAESSEVESSARLSIGDALNQYLYIDMNMGVNATNGSDAGRLSLSLAKQLLSAASIKIGLSLCEAGCA